MILDTVTLSLIIAVAGTILHQIRTYNGKSLPKILDAALITVGSSFVASYTILSQIDSTDQYLQVLTIISLVGGTIPAGILSQKIFTKTKQKVQSKTSEDVLQNTISKAPELFPKESWYQTNLKKSDHGKYLQYGQVHLWIRVKDVRSYVTVILKDANGIALQIDQSHHLDEDNNIETTRLELLKADGTPFPKGIYHITIRGDRGTGDSAGIAHDTFEIV